ncbi:hypothetical protein BAUCODRAFT_578121 [Baudoinia panamericana UAMH 10762]|uniref:Uncharacterized protein n=1 Tax=Baudoinia panamericana (strain UAMH 10762) TaxID=717646 RepID=M2N9C2_BAUPA|nr:uncharacterized protein BAUCODRAFT_578121 [Baudoinia panamericana UAMH 10762]EMC95415.1 hypothetical protein BAUCODRAFT_578121 [Baudoinia panamericana UAMH 10762]
MAALVMLGNDDPSPAIGNNLCDCLNLAASPEDRIAGSMSTRMATKSSRIPNLASSATVTYSQAYAGSLAHKTSTGGDTESLSSNYEPEPCEQLPGGVPDSYEHTAQEVSMTRPMQGPRLTITDQRKRDLEIRSSPVEGEKIPEIDMPYDDGRDAAATDIVRPQQQCSLRYAHPSHTSDELPRCSQPSVMQATEQEPEFVTDDVSNANDKSLKRRNYNTGCKYRKWLIGYSWLWQL